MLIMRGDLGQYVLYLEYLLLQESKKVRTFAAQKRRCFIRALHLFGD